MPFRARAQPARVVLHRDAVRFLRKASVTRAPPQPDRGPSRTTQSTFFHPHKLQNPTLEPRTKASPSFLSKLFKRRSSPSRTSANPAEAYAEFLTATQSHDIPAMKAAYDTIVSAIDQAPSSSTLKQTYISPQELLAAMHELEHSTSSTGFALLYRMYGDNSRRFGFKDTPVHHRLMIGGYYTTGRVREALTLARTRDPGEVNWSALLQAAAKHDPRQVDEVVGVIKQTQSLSTEDYGHLLSHLRRESSLSAIIRQQSQERLSEILGEMEELGLKLNLKHEAEVVRIYLMLGYLAQAEKIAAGWDGVEATTNEIRAALFDLRIFKGDRDGVIALCQATAQAQIHAPPRAMAFLVESRLAGPDDVGADDVGQAVSEVEQETGIEVTGYAWTELVQNFIGRSGLDTALQVYDAAQGRGVVTDIRLAQLLIIPLCSTQPPRFEQALRIYNDLISSERPMSDVHSRRTLSELYESLLNACSESRLTFSLATPLLNDMRSRGVTISSANRNSLIVSLMSAAPDHASAFRIYSLINSLSSSPLTKEAYDVIATAFLKLSWDASPFVPLNLFLELMKDMHRAGQQPGARILTSLLHQYGVQASGLKQIYMSPEKRGVILRGIVRAVRDVHTRIKLDPLIEVDIPLLNALMDAYNRAGSYYSALEVWEELVERRSREPAETVKADFEPSVCIILDCCGYSGRPQRAKKIWAWARRHGLADDRKLWDTYVECLCRCDEMDEAVELVCGVMKHGAGGAAQASRESCEILLKFSWRNPRWFEQVQARVREAFPEWWDQLRGIVEKGNGSA